MAIRIAGLNFEGPYDDLRQSAVRSGIYVVLDARPDG